MSIPNQICGISTFSGPISKCPPNPNAIRSVVFSRDSNGANLAVVNGAATEITLSLGKFFVPVLNAARSSFSIPGALPVTPLTVYKLDLAGLDVDGKVKFLALLPTYGTSSNVSSICGSTAAATTAQLEYMEWCFMKDLDDGDLYDAPILGPSGSSISSFITSTVNKLDFSWGTYLSFTGGTGSIWAATDGGLLKWNGINATLWNTLNSNSPSDYISTLAVDAYNSVWVGSNQGIARFSESNGFALQWNSENSGLQSDIVNELKLFNTEKIAIGTDSGLSITDYVGSTWSNFNMFNTPELGHNNIASLNANDNYIFAGTTGGVYVYEHVTNVWNSLPFNSTNTPGWTADDNVLSLESYNGNLYVGTSTGLVVVPYLGGTAQTIVSGVTGPGSNYFQSLRIVSYSGMKLYAGHDDGFSAYNIDTDTWYATENGTFNSFFYGGINDVLPDFLSGATAVETMFFANGASSQGLAKYEYPSSNFSLVPESNKAANLLLSLPSNPASTPLASSPGYPGIWQYTNGNTSIDGSRLYPSNQPMYFVFSKNMLPGTSFESKVLVKSGLTGGGATITGTWAWDTTGRIGTFTPSQPFLKASEYNFTLTPGATANDGSFLREKANVGFYTEDLVPILGWNVMGKMLIHTGTEGNYTEGLYLRNPQSTTVNVLTLIGR